ncbi:MAG: 16S rRNA (guanine(966)-N(2))-methyltransferase RsmD [Planctomycetes bacterium]|nr:16S rRNA (guanine(966)-N(2))-methyltransferase RsmD [Planctomycetota bacterium]
MLRITGGEHRGRKLRVPAVAATRPLVERAREGVMNHLRAELPGAVVWDIYAGSGILGLEALSRGAAQVVAVEKHGRAAQQLLENAQLLRVDDRVRILRIDAHRLLEMFTGGAAELPRPDLIFFDPPYADFRNGAPVRAKVWSLFCALGGLLAPGGAAVVHTPKGILDEDERAVLPGIEQRDYGSTSLYWWHPTEN